MGRTALLFTGLDDNDVPREALVHFGNEAYENYMAAGYARELMRVRHDANYVCWAPNLEYLHVAIRTLGKVQFEEFGSTLFSTIDKFEKLDRRHGGGATISYVGIEVSQLLIDIAVGLHPTAELQHFRRWQDAPTPEVIVSRSYQATSYGFRTTAELVEWVARAEVGLHGIWFSLNGERDIEMMGNRVTLFDPARFGDMAAAAGFTATVFMANVYSHGDERFGAAWVLCERRSFEGRPAAVCGLDELADQPYAGPHAGLIPIRSGRPFDFADLQSR
jgi:hypothetical protein